MKDNEKQQVPTDSSPKPVSAASPAFPETLKPCPFCGGEAFARIGSYSVGYVCCTQCRIETPTQNTKAEAIAKWNTRPLETALYEALKAIDEAWSHDGHSPENAHSLTVFTDDTIERWKNIRAALAKAVQA